MAPLVKMAIFLRTQGLGLWEGRILQQMLQVNVGKLKFHGSSSNLSTQTRSEPGRLEYTTTPSGNQKTARGTRGFSEVEEALLKDPESAEKYSKTTTSNPEPPTPNPTA